MMRYVENHKLELLLGYDKINMGEGGWVGNLKGGKMSNLQPLFSYGETLVKKDPN
jgi:hypothetical protein